MMQNILQKYKIQVQVHSKMEVIDVLHCLCLLLIENLTFNIFDKNYIVFHSKCHGFLIQQRLSWFWSYGSFIYNYMYLCKSVPITTIIVSSNPVHGEVCSIHVIKFVSVLWHVGGFLRVLHFCPPIKLTSMI
jgi:hypothetical protein